MNSMVLDRRVPGMPGLSASFVAIDIFKRCYRSHKAVSSVLFVQPRAFSSRSRLFFGRGVAYMFSRLLTQHETESERSSPNNFAALSYKDGCKNRFYRQIWLAPFRKNGKIFWQRLSGKPHFRQRMLAKLCF